MYFDEQISTFMCILAKAMTFVHLRGEFMAA